MLPSIKTANDRQLTEKKPIPTKYVGKIIQFDSSSILPHNNTINIMMYLNTHQHMYVINYCVPYIMDAISDK